MYIGVCWRKLSQQVSNYKCTINLNASVILLFILNYYSFIVIADCKILYFRTTFVEKIKMEKPLCILNYWDFLSKHYFLLKSKCSVSKSLMKNNLCDILFIIVYSEYT